MLAASSVMLVSEYDLSGRVGVKTTSRMAAKTLEIVSTIRNEAGLALFSGNESASFIRVSNVSQRNTLNTFLWRILSS